MIRQYIEEELKAANLLYKEHCRRRNAERANFFAGKIAALEKFADDMGIKIKHI